MKLLALDTSTEACSVALRSDGETRDAYELAGRQQTERILPMVESLLASAAIRPAQLDGIIFGRGPGAFTGLRVSAGVVQGLAYGLGIPVLPVSSLNILAQTAYRLYRCRNLVSIFDARMSEVYWCSYVVKDGLMVACSDEKVSSPNAVGPEPGLPWCAAGPGLTAYDEVFSKSTFEIGRRYPDLYPSARDAIELGEKVFAAGRFVEPEAAIPVYVRNDVAWKKLRK